MEGLNFTSTPFFVNPSRASAKGRVVVHPAFQCLVWDNDHNSQVVFTTIGQVEKCDLIIPSFVGIGGEQRARTLKMVPIFQDRLLMESFFGAAFGFKSHYANIWEGCFTFQTKWDERLDKTGKFFLLSRSIYMLIISQY